MIQKPPHGAPCNNCGQCCRAELCPLGAVVFGRERGPCPALEPIAGGGEGCGLVMSPQKYARPREVLEFGAPALTVAAIALIGAGRGCDAQLAGEPENTEFRRSMVKQRDRRGVDKALRTWGVVRA